MNEKQEKHRNEANLHKIRSLYQSYDNGTLNDRDFKSNLQSVNNKIIKKNFNEKNFISKKFINGIKINLGV